MTQFRHNMGHISIFVLGLVAVATIAVIAFGAAVLGAEHARGMSGSSSPAIIASPSTGESSPALPPGGINAEQAIELAVAHVEPGATVVSADAGVYGDLFTVLPPENRSVAAPARRVWVVTFDQTFTICPPDGGACWSPRSGRTQVVMDYGTGEYIESASLAAAPE